MQSRITPSLSDDAHATVDAPPAAPSSLRDDEEGPAFAKPRRATSARLKRTVLSAMAAMLSALAPSAAMASSPHGAASHEDAGDSGEDKPEKSEKATAKVDVKVDTKVTTKATAKVTTKKTTALAVKTTTPKKPVAKVDVKVEADDDKPVHKSEKAEKIKHPEAHAAVTAKVTKPKIKVDDKVKATASVGAGIKKDGKTKIAAAEAHTKDTKITAGVHVKDTKVAASDQHVKGHRIAATSHVKATKHSASVHVKEGGDERATASLDVPSSSKGKRPKKTAARELIGSKKRALTGASAKKLEAAKKPCYAGRVHVDRGGLESESFPLTDCAGNPLGSARERLGVLVRPWGAAKPAHLSYDKLPKPNAKGEIAPGVRLVDPGVLTRLEAIAEHFPGKSFSFVSGYRPQSKGSEHQTGRAVDVRVVGVPNEELVAFCKTLKDTGCGYYPNSSFVHVDVRNPKTGSAYWIDASGPGESPHYVTRWPPPKGESEEAQEPAAAPLEEQSHDDVTTDLMPRRALGEYRDRPVD